MDWRMLIEILGSENVDSIKRAITEEIINNIRESINKEWIITPAEFDDMFDELGKEVFEEVKRKYKKELKQVVCENMEELILKLKERKDD